MSELMNNIRKGNLRSEMNLIYTMMRFMATILDMVPDSQIARETLCTIAEGVFCQATELYRDVGTYTAAISDTPERDSAPEERKNKAGDANEADIQY